MGFAVKATVKLDLHIDEAKAELGDKFATLVRWGALRVQSLAVANLYAGIYARPEDPKRPRTGALANSVYAEIGDGSYSDESEKSAAVTSLNPKAAIGTPEFAPVGPFEAKTGVAVEYGLYMEAYMPFLEPAAIQTQTEIADAWVKS